MEKLEDKDELGGVGEKEISGDEWEMSGVTEMFKKRIWRKMRIFWWSKRKGDEWEMSGVSEIFPNGNLGRDNVW